MTVCPKCNKKIPFYHIGQLCPHCKVNIRFYSFDKDFYHDAKKAELSLAKINIFIAHLKANYIGSKLAIIRLFAMILPAVSLLVPFAYANISQPFFNYKFDLSALGVFNAFSDGTLNYIFTMTSGGPDRTAFLALLLAIACFAAVALFAALVLLLTILSIINIKKMPKVLCFLSIFGIIATAVALVMCLRFPRVAGQADGVILSGGISFGYILTFVSFTVTFIINVLLSKKGLNIVYKEGDLERKEIAAKVKKGEIRIDDLPQPIVETKETRLIDEEIKTQQELYRKKEKESFVQGGGGDEKA